MNELELFTQNTIKKVFLNNALNTFDKNQWPKSAWKIEKSKFHGLMGENGIGKSYLIKLIKSMNHNFTIAYSDQLPLAPLSKLKIEDILLLLEDNLIDFSVKKYLGLKSLFQVDLDQEKEVNLLSGGENQVFKTLLALSRDCDLYIFDEPFTFLSSVNQKVFLDLLENSFREKTVLLIEHNQELVSRLCDYVWELKRVSPDKALEINLKESLEFELD